MNRITLIIIRALAVIIGFAALVFPLASGLAQESYEFERMWPAYQKPWYFSPVAIAVDSAENIYITDHSFNRIQKFNPDGEPVAKWATWGDEDGNVREPEGIVIDMDGFIYIADTNNNRVQKWDARGRFVLKWGSKGAGQGQFMKPKGITIDRYGYLYVADTGNHRIQKFSRIGGFIEEYGVQGTEAGEFKSPEGLVVDNNGNIFVADTGNHRIQKFDADGNFMTEWGSYGTGYEQFDAPQGITIGNDGNLCVVDRGNRRVYKFTSDGNPLGVWGEDSGSGFSYPQGVAINRDGYIYVTDKEMNSIQKFNSDGILITEFKSFGTEDGEFILPRGIAINNDGKVVYVADFQNARVQKFTSEGEFLTKWGTPGTGEGQFKYPHGVAIDTNGDVYVSDKENHCVQKFGPDGGFIRKWGEQGAGKGQFNEPQGVAIGPDGAVYVADASNHRIQVFTSDGEFVSEWGKEGEEDGEFENPVGVVTDSSGYVYVGDIERNCIQKFTGTGEFVTQWGIYGSEDGQFDWASGLAVDEDDNIYVTDSFNHRIQKFTSDGIFITAFGKRGSDPGQFYRPFYLAVGADGRLFVSDGENNRVQVFRKADTSTGISKAIIVAGSGPYRDYHLFKPTQRCAAYAYWALVSQGYTKERIYYLSVEDDLDLDGNGKADDVDGEPSTANLEEAIRNWASDADELVVYIAGRGETERFRISESEYLQSKHLGTWIDALQESVQNSVTLIYDAGRSGSFLRDLIPSGPYKRLVLTSVSADQEAVFASDGYLSFSYLFWNYIFSGDSFFDAFLYAKSAMAQMYTRDPQVDGDGDGLGNEEEDMAAARERRIGNETRYHADIPFIEKVSADPDLLEDDFTASIRAENVTDSDGIRGIWAVVTPPNYAGDNPPVVEMDPDDDDNCFEASYDGFVNPGKYTVTVFALDNRGTLSLPKTTVVTVVEGEKAGEGYVLTNDLWIKAVIHTDEKGPIEAVWQQGGEADTGGGHHVIWGYFYANPTDVNWGSQNNPDLFVKIWFDAGGRVDVNFFHVSVPDIEVFSAYPYKEDASFTPDETGTTTLNRRYIRQYYENGQSDSDENDEDGEPASGYDPTGAPWGSVIADNLRIGAVINTEKGQIDGFLRPGGEDTTSRGDVVIWGYYFAHPKDVSWGNLENPEVFVKVWFDVTGRIDVNYFHVSVPEIEVFSAHPISGSSYEQKGTVVMADRYIRQSYEKTVYSKPTANFKSSCTSGTAPLGVGFSDKSDGRINSRVWDFGDDQTGDEKEPYHVYENPGEYTVTLTVKGPGGDSDSETKTKYITVRDPHDPI
jgi:DNA-binding beta-propeller fold protein YncE/PKD repeat protein